MKNLKSKLEHEKLEPEFSNVSKGGPIIDQT